MKVVSNVVVVFLLYIYIYNVNGGKETTYGCIMWLSMQLHVISFELCG